MGEFSDAARSRLRVGWLYRVLPLARLSMGCGSGFEFRPRPRQFNVSDSDEIADSAVPPYRLRRFPG